MWLRGYFGNLVRSTITQIIMSYSFSSVGGMSGGKCEPNIGVVLDFLEAPYNIDIYIRTRIYIIFKMGIEKPMNRLKRILFTSFPTNKIPWLLLCILIDFMQMNIIYF